MKAFVFTDESLREQAGRFVWLELNTDRAENVEVKERLGVKALPTYFVLDPRSEAVILKWVGGATVPQLHALLAQAEGNFSRLRSGELSGGEGSGAPDDLLARADLAYGANRTPEAADLYERAISASPPGWPSYSRAVEQLLLAWLLEGSCERAAPFARSAHPRLAGTSSVAIVASVGLDCALELPEDDPRKAELVAYFEDACRDAVAYRSIPMADDDRSGLYVSLLSARRAAGDSLGAVELAAEWAEFLEEAASAAPTPEARSVFDSHRLAAYRELGQPERAVEMLRQSERDLPEDDNPPARLAIAYREMGRADEALASSRRAVDLAYGPRLVRHLQFQVDLHLALADTASAREVLAQAIREARGLPEAQRSDRTMRALEERLVSLGGGAAAGATGTAG